MSFSSIRNGYPGPVTLPPPFLSAFLGPGQAIVVAMSVAEIRTALGGALGTGGSLEITALSDSYAGPVNSTQQGQVTAKHVRYNAPIAKSANAAACLLVTDAVVANGAQVVAAQPDYPRKLLLFVTDANSSITAGTLDLVGIGPSGEALAESITLVGGSISHKSVNAYAHLTSATVTGVLGNTGADKIALGVDSALGLPGSKTPLGRAFSVYKADVDQANEAVGTVDATAGTLDPTTTPNGAHTYDVWYTYTIN